MSKEERDELEYLRWFYCNADFGPAHGDVIFHMNEEYVSETGNSVPEGYDEE